MNLEMLNRAVINTSTYKNHSTRQATLSKSLNQGLNLQSLLNKGGSKSEIVSRKHY